jgi:hypothetical protein
MNGPAIQAQIERAARREHGLIGRIPDNSP